MVRTRIFRLRGCPKGRHRSPDQRPRRRLYLSHNYSLYQEALPALSLWELILDRPFHLKIHEDKQATILVARKGFSSKLRCVQRTHKVNLACIAEQLESEHISIEYVQTDMQSADIFTKALPPNKWDHAIRLLGIRVDLPEKLEDVRESRAAKAAA